MNILQIVQAACRSPAIPIDSVSAVFGSAETESLEFAELANEVAKRIMRAHEWQDLKLKAVITGDGTTTSWNLPADYDRMLVDGHIWISDNQRAMHHVVSSDEWLRLEVQLAETITDAWTLWGGQIRTLDAIASGVTAQYFYISNSFALDAGSSPVGEFTNDTDTFRLDDQLLKLGIIWQWREMKGLPYAEDLQNYEMLLAKRNSADKGARVLHVGPARFSLGEADFAYPFALSQA